MNDREKVKVLRAGLEEIREETFEPYVKKDVTPRDWSPRGTPDMQKKIRSWRKIQSIAARALRDTEDDDGEGGT